MRGRPAEDDVGVTLGGGQHSVAVTEAGGEDDLHPFGDELIDERLDLGFGHRFDNDGLDVGDGLDQLLATEVVGVGPAGIADRSDVDEADLEGVLGHSEAQEQGEKGDQQTTHGSTS